MIGKELRQIRVKLGLTQKLMAERLGLQRNTVARMERDEIGISGPVERLARLILDVQRLTSNMGFTERVLLLLDGDNETHTTEAQKRGGQ